MDTIGEDSENFREANEAYITGKQEDYRSATRYDKMWAENPTIATIQDLFGVGKEGLRKEREARGMGLSSDNAKKAGQVVGRVGQDIVRDASRGSYWLINAPQAVVDVAVEQAIKGANPDLRKQSVIRDENYEKVYYDPEDFTQAERAGFTNADGVRQKGISLGDAEDYTDDKGRVRQRRPYVKSNIAPGLVNTLRGPGALAVNAGMGLLHYGGGMEGYTAAIPSEEDPTKTANVLAEIGAKYIVGRTGNLLPYEEFRKVRPDVSEAEYKAYKAFKYDKSMDLDPSDGNVNLLPLGLLKATADGIHGAEVQFLGRSLPVNETMIPVATAALGSIAGSYGGQKRVQEYEESGKKFLGVIPPVMADKNLKPETEERRKQLQNRTVRRGLIGGLAGYGTGAILGNAIEGERRRRNKEENFPE